VIAFNLKPLPFFQQIPVSLTLRQICQRRRWQALVGAGMLGLAQSSFGNPFPANFELSSLDGTNGFKLSGVVLGDRAGGGLSGDVDINGDGLKDVLIGAATANPNGNKSGASYVVFGRPAGFPANLNLQNLNGINGFKLSGVAPDDRSGYSLGGAGDVNGDGLDDLIIGAREADPKVVFGSLGGFPPNLQLSTLDGTNGFTLLRTAADERAGWVSAAGDVNGDGLNDVMIGAPRTNSFAGVVYVVFGNAGGFPAELPLASLDGSNGFKLSGVKAYDRAGFAVNKAGDVNGDGWDDLLIGALAADPNGSYSGATYVVFGRPFGFPAELNLGKLNGINGFKLSGERPNDRSGRAISGAVDINGDGMDDIIIGADGVPSGGSRGATYVVFGSAGGFPAEFQLSSLNGSNGFIILGQSTADILGRRVSGLGDVNGDGLDDLITGAFGADPNGEKSGAAYVVFGRKDGFPAYINVASLDGSNGFKLSGIAPGDETGRRVSRGGDINGDGVDDLLISAHRADPNGEDSGEVYVVFGMSGSFPAVINLAQ